MKKPEKSTFFFSLGMVIAVLALCEGSLTGAPGRGKTANQNPAENTKIQTFLFHVLVSNSIMDISSEFKKAGFSEGQKKILQKELKNPPYSSKLEGLLNQSRNALPAYSPAKFQQKTRRMKEALAEKQAKELKRLNTQAGRELGRIKNELKNTTARMRTSLDFQKISARMKREMLAFSRKSPAPAGISSILPSTALIGRDIIIRGFGFGVTRGTLIINVGDHYSYFRNISSWTDRRIVATIPYSHESGGVYVIGVERLVGATEKEAIVWVKPHGRLTGPTQEFRIRPDFTEMEPVITGLSSLEVRPGLSLIIRGENFLSESEGTVQFFFPGNGGVKKFFGIVREWRDSFVHVVLPEDLPELPEGEGECVLSNNVPHTVRHSLMFRPDMEVRAFSAHRSLEADYIIGYKEINTDHDFRLINGWTVKDYELYISGSGPGFGARYILSPQPGSTEAGSRVEIWADLFSGCDYYNYLWIEGPKGTRYR
jgi:hypothetical protein